MQILNTKIFFVQILILNLGLVTVFAQPISKDSTDNQHEEGSPAKESWGSIDPGKGFLVGKNKLGSISISPYILIRYINQLPANQFFTDHLGRRSKLDTRNDIQLHRILLSFTGFVYKPQIDYTVTVWTVNSTNQVAIVGALGYKFNKRFNLYGGIIGNAGTRSLLGSHPYWLGTDRVMADEYFRPGFTSGIWAAGEILPRVGYRAMLGNNISLLGINATELTRSLTPSLSMWWMPTTGEFGPRGGYGDFEGHEKLATRFGFSMLHSRDNRFADLSQNYPDNTQIRISDGLLFFETGSLAPNVTVIEANIDILSLDAGFKYKGFFFHTEYYFRNISKILADGPVPESTIFDHGFQIQTSYTVLPKKLELYTATSQIFGQFRFSNEFLGGINYYPADTRNFRVNAQVIKVYRSAAGSVFGYYLAGQNGTTISLASSVFF